MNFIEASEEGDKARRLLPAGWDGAPATVPGFLLLPVLFADFALPALPTCCPQDFSAVKEGEVVILPAFGASVQVRTLALMA